MRLVLLPNGEKINPANVTRVRKVDNWNIAVQFTDRSETCILVNNSDVKTDDEHKAKCQRVFNEVCNAIDNGLLPQANSIDFCSYVNQQESMPTMTPIQPTPSENDRMTAKLVENAVLGSIGNIPVGRPMSATPIPHGVDCDSNFYNFCLDNFTCKICMATPDIEGNRSHGRGCYTQSEDGGGEDWIDLERECEQYVLSVYPQSRCCRIAGSTRQQVLNLFDKANIGEAAETQYYAWINAAVAVWKAKQEPKEAKPT